MARDTNIVVISGRVINPIELRETIGGKAVADFKLVSNHKQLPRDDPDRLKYAVFVKVTLWGNEAEFWAGEGEKQIDPLSKGDEVLVEGSLFSDDFIPNGSDTPTSGRIRLDNAKVKLMKRSRRHEREEE